MKIIPYGKQFIDHTDKKSVLKTLSNDLITTGPQVSKFEKKICDYLDVKYSTVCNSGTSAIYLALKSLNIKKDDIIIMPTINFVASYNVAKLLGAKVYLADINSRTGLMSPADVLNCCKKFNLKKVKVIITMYHGGYPEDAKNFFNLKKKIGCKIVEDACHAFGSQYKVKNKFFKIGSCRHSDISTFSLHPLKTITTGEGGIVTTKSKKLDDKIKNLRSLGIRKNNKNHWEYDVTEFGLNLRLNDIQCALGISQLEKINYFLKSRKKIAKRYDLKLKKIKQISIPKYTKTILPSYHLYFINLLNFDLKKKNKFLKFMKKKGIFLQYHYIPIYKFKVFNDKYINVNSKKYYNETVSLPIFHELSKKDQNYVVKSINLFFKKKS